MGRVLIARFGRLLATLFAVTFLSFMLTSLLPGDPAVAVLGQEGIQNEELLEQVREDLGDEVSVAEADEAACVAYPGDRHLIVAYQDGGG